MRHSPSGHKWTVRLVLVLALLAILLSAIDILVSFNASPSTTRARDYLLPGVLFTLGVSSLALTGPTFPFAMSKRAWSIVNWSAFLLGCAVAFVWGAELYSALAEAGPLALLDWILVLPIPLAVWCVVRGFQNLFVRPRV